MFVARTRAGLLLGPFASYEEGDEFAKACIFEIDDIYRVVEPRQDQLKAGSKLALKGNRR